MEQNSKDVMIQEWWDLTREAGEEGAKMAINFSVTGLSMVPTIRNRLDTVIVLPRRRQPVVGDIVLFQKKNICGNYVLHRVMEAEEEGVLTIGDGNLAPDGWTRMERVYGIAVAVKRGKHTLDLTGGVMVFWGKLWLKLLPVRGPLLKLFSLLAWIKNAVMGKCTAGGTAQTDAQKKEALRSQKKKKG